MEPIERTLDLEEEAGRIRSEALPRLEEKLEEIEEEAAEISPPEAQEDPEGARERMQVLEANFDQYEAQRVTVKGYARILERAVEEWGGSEVVMKELSGREARIIKDTVTRRAEKMDTEQYMDGIHEVEAMQRIVVSTPPGGPDPNSIENVPDRLFSWLYQRGNALNTVGEMDMGNSSLQERLAERTS